MASIRLLTDQPAQFPPVCVCCGKPATEYRRRWFTWTPGLSMLFAFLGTWRYWRVTLEVPFCHAHRHYFTKRWLPLLVIGLLVVGGAVAAYITTDIRQGKEAARDLENILIPSVLGVLALLGIVGFLLKLNGLRVTDVNGDEFTWSGVCGEFAAAMEKRSTAVPVVVAADDNEPPVVTAVAKTAPLARLASRSSPAPLVQAAPKRRIWLIVLVSALIAILVPVAYVIYAMWMYTSDSKSKIHLSNARMERNAGLIANVSVDCRIRKTDPAAKYFWVIRIGSNSVMNRQLTPQELQNGGPLRAQLGVMFNADPATYETLIEVEKPGGGREPASNTVRFKR